jgi:hypothetical protein
METPTSDCALKSGFETSIAHVTIVVAFWGWRLEPYERIGIVSDLVAVNGAFINSVFPQQREEVAVDFASKIKHSVLVL